MKLLIYSFNIKIYLFKIIPIVFKYRLYYFIDKDWFFYYKKNPFSIFWEKHHTKNDLNNSLSIMYGIRKRYSKLNYKIYNEYKNDPLIIDLNKINFKIEPCFLK